MTEEETSSRVTASVAETPGAIAHDAGLDFLRAKDPVTVVIFGASGDLAKRKLLPALYQLQESGYLPERYSVIGFSRTPMTDEAYRESMRKAVSETVKKEVPAAEQLVSSLYYHAGDADKPESYQTLKAKIEALERERNLPGNRLFYLSVLA